MRWIVIAGLDPAIHLLCKKPSAKRIDPRVKPGGDVASFAKAELLSLPLRPRSRLGGKAQPSGRLERLGVEGADLDRAADVERHRDAALGHRRADHARAFAVEAKASGLVQQAIDRAKLPGVVVAKGM